MFTITDYAMNRSGQLHGKFLLFLPMNNIMTKTMTVHNPKMWDNLDAQFLKHLDSVDKDLKSNGLPGLKK